MGEMTGPVKSLGTLETGLADRAASNPPLRRFPPMRTEPLTQAERDAEIAALVVRRDRLLAKAPRTLGMQGYAALFCALLLAFGEVQILLRPLTTNALYALGFFGLLLLLCLWTGMRSLRRRPQAGDLWGAAARVNYETESPIDLQRRIDELRQP